MTDVLVHNRGCAKHQGPEHACDCIPTRETDRVLRDVKFSAKLDGIVNTPIGRAPRVVTTTLLGPGTGHLVAEALGSARALGIVHHLIIPWNCTTEDLQIVAALRGVRGEPAPYIAEPFDGKGGFSGARNYALLQAERLQAEWAITLDTDERLLSQLQDFQVLLGGDADVLLVSDAAGGYAKDRAFRIPAKGRWTGPTHETYIPGPTEVKRHALAADLSFTELPKTPDQMKAKAERDVRLLGVEYARTNDPRWAFYLGESYAILAATIAPGDPLQPGGRYAYLHDAIQAYRNCARLRDTPVWDHFREEGGWAMFKAARLLSELTPNGRLHGTDYLDLLLEGMRVCPWMAELPYLAAHLEVLDPKRRLAWAMMAIRLGRVEGIDIPRMAWFEGRALYEAPYDLAGIAYTDMGEKDRADQMFSYAHAAKEFRLKRGE